jgi:hypothetical protein
MSKEAWLANYERSEECSRMIDSPRIVVSNVEEKTITCEDCGVTYFIGGWPWCPHDKAHYSWHFKGEKK